MNKERLIGVVDALRTTIFESAFAGKDHGRFKIARQHLMSLLGVAMLRDEDIALLTYEALQRGLVIINLDRHFSVMQAHVALGFRPVPKALVSKTVDALNEKHGASLHLMDEDEDDE